MMRVVIFHNVAVQCRTCQRPAIAVGSGYAHLGRVTALDADHPVVASSPGLRTGYEPDHALVRVFVTEVADSKVPSTVADRMWRMFTTDPQFQDGRDAETALAYRKRELRTLRGGDVILVGETALAADRRSSRWLPVDAATLNEVQTGDWGSVPWARQ